MLVVSALLYADTVRHECLFIAKDGQREVFGSFQQPDHLPCRFMYDIMHGVDIIIAAIQPALDAASPSAAANPAAATPQEEQPLIEVPLRIAVYVTNLGIILPASSK